LSYHEITEMFLRSNQNRTIDKEFVLDFAQEHLTLLHQKYDHCLLRNDMVESEILLPLMLKC